MLELQSIRFELDNQDRPMYRKAIDINKLAIVKKCFLKLNLKENSIKIREIKIINLNSQIERDNSELAEHSLSTFNVATIPL